MQIFHIKGRVNLRKSTKLIIAGVVAVVLLPLVYLQLETGAVTKKASNVIYDSKYGKCGFLDKEWDQLEEAGITNASIDEMVANASSPGVVCDDLEDMLYDIQNPELTEEEEAAKEKKSAKLAEAANQAIEEDNRRIEKARTFIDTGLKAMIEPVLVDDFNMKYRVEADEHYAGNINVFVDAEQESKQGKKLRKAFIQKFGDGDVDANYQILILTEDESVIARVSLPEL